MSEQKTDFESALKRLETIAEEMENGTLSLEQMIRHFEEGSKLAAFCTTRLNEVEQKIEKLVRKGNEIATEPLDATPESGD